MSNVLRYTAPMCLAFLLAGCATSIAKQPNDQTQRILLRGAEIHVPAEMTIDLRFRAQDDIRIILREPVGDTFASKSIGISFVDIDEEAESIFQEIGYEIRKVCSFRVFTLEDPNIGRSVIIAIEQAMVQLTGIEETHEQRILHSICNPN